ncbi:unnamed protein product [Dibothriocephalus latus]|uniref:Uncharacterized protein n=1 Tax=Dibothriocephalus latus TaxID=60516 RepID=A0A3P6PZK6_DIBLA|nr:unnamed protein product [Dibothriocephalus latus]
MGVGGVILSVRVCFSIIFLSLALALGHWPCGTLTDSCLSSSDSEIYGKIRALLISSLALNCVAFVVGILGAVFGDAISGGGQTLSGIGGILALAAVAYYYSHLDENYSPMLAVMGMCYSL